MNLILLTATDYQSPDTQLVRLTDYRFHHIRSVHKAKIGDVLKVGLINGLLGTGTLVSLTDTYLEMTTELSVAPPPPLPVTLICALPRPKTIIKVVQSATTLGIKRLIFIKTWRVEKSYWKSPVLETESLLKHCMIGLEQTCDTILPLIEIKPLFKPFIEDEVPAIIQNTKAFVAHPYAEQTVSAQKKDTPLTIAIGPEGGFIPYELSMFAENGFTPVSFGGRILRVETAIPYILGRIA